METRKAVRVALMIALCAATAIPCSWDTTPAFAFRVRPDDPIDRYVDGRIGIIRPEYARSHLVVAYRHLSGNPPSGDEREGFLELLQHRLKEIVPEHQGQAWEKARAEFRGVAPGREPDVNRYAGPYLFFTNCTDDAFVKAAAVLRDRAARFGAKSPAVTSWLDAQEIVFGNCGEGEAVPQSPDPSLPPLIRADRAYQIAAANFYAMKYDDARAQFLAIASDAGSPWRQTARIVAARAMLRKSTLQAKSDDDNSYVFLAEPMQQAERDLRAILADASMAQFHDQARQLLRFAAFRLRPAQRFGEVASALARGGASARDTRTSLDEYTLLLDQLEFDRLKLDTSDDLTSWIQTFKSGGDATAKWRETKKPHWLVAALASASEKDAAELLEASSRIGADSVAFAMIAYHRARLLLASKKTDQARAEIDRVLLLDEEKLPPSARNLLLDQRRTVARSLTEYLRDVQLTPVGNESEQYPDAFAFPLLPEDAANVLSTSMPLDMLADAAMTKELAKQIRNPILIAAWTRAILLDREDVASRLAPGVVEIAPGLEKRFTAWLKAGAEQRRFAAADLIIHNGGLQPSIDAYGGRLASDNDLESVNHNGGNWWCFRAAGTPPALPPFLAEPEAASTAANEQLALIELGSGATWMLNAYLDLAEADPKNPRVPEGLSLAVQGVRWACGDAETDALAEKAFNVLHKRYAATKWARETPYWYKSGF